jgi:hypothetical protein
MKEKIEAHIEKNPAEREKILEVLDKIRDFHDVQKCDLLEVLEGEKPASAISLSLRDDCSEEKEKTYKENVEFLKNFLDSHANFFEFYEEVFPGIKIGNFLIAKEKKEFEDIKKADEKLKKSNTPEDQYEFGVAVGYPETAVKAFKNDTIFRNKNKMDSKKIPAIETMDWEEYPEEMLSDKDIRFLPFRPSRKNWKKEFQTVKRWAKTIEEKYPALYKRMTEKYITQKMKQN